MIGAWTSPDGDWRLTCDGDVWRLRNTSGQVRRGVSLRFEGALDGRGWWEDVELRDPRLEPDRPVPVRIPRADTTTRVTVRWRAGLVRTGSWTAEIRP